MAVTYKDINQLTKKSTVAGTEKLPVSDTQFITPEQIAALAILGDGVENVVALTTAQYEALATKDPTTTYIITDDNFVAENTANKVTSISASSTNTQYPSAKCVYDIVGNIETLLAAL